MFPAPTLGLAIGGLSADAGAPWTGGARGAIGWAAEAGFGAVQLDAAEPGLRPRELHRSARRDLAGLLRRSRLCCSGLDLWIPPAHYADPARADRALAAVLQAIELAADLAALIGDHQSRGEAGVSITLPASGAEAARDAIAARAGARGLRVADHAASCDGAAPEASPIGIGLEAGALLRAGEDPVTLIARLGPRIASVRLGDPAAWGPGGLEPTTLTAALSVAGYARPVVLDLRGIGDPGAAARRAVDAWPAAPAP